MHPHAYGGGAGALRHHAAGATAAAPSYAKTATPTTRAAASHGNVPGSCSLAADRAALLSALVSAALARAPGAADPGGAPHLEAYHARLLSFAARLLGSGVSSGGGSSSAAAPSSSDTATVVSGLKLRLLAQRRDRDAIALDERYARLCALHAAAGAGGRLAARSHGAALQLLAALSPSAGAGGSGGAVPVGSLAGYQPLRLPDVRLPGSLASASAQEQQQQQWPMLLPLIGGEAGADGGGGASVFGGDFMGLNSAAQQQQRARVTQQQQQQQQRAATPPPPCSAAAAATAATQTTTTASRLPDALAREASIVRDVLRAAQHIDGAHVAFDLPPSSSLPPWHRANCGGGGGGGGGAGNNIAGSADPALAALDRGVRVAPYADTRLHPGQRALVHALGGELGLVVEAVRRHAAAGGGGGGGDGSGGYDGGGSGADDVSGAGAVRLAFAGALSAELADFYRVMALLEAQARFRAPPPVPSAALVPGAGDGGDDDHGDDHAAAYDERHYDDDDGDGDANDESGAFSSSAPYLTLRRLALWLSEPLRRMRALAAAADACAPPARGAALAGRLWALSRTGDPAQRALLGRVLRASCAPLFECTLRWVLEGALVDDAGEFFVVRAGGGRGGGGGGGEYGADARARRSCSYEDDAAAAADSAPADPWRDSYRIDPSRVPPFVSSSLARRALRAGKCLFFLRDVCGDGQWAAEHARGAALEAAAADAAAAAAAEAAGEEDDGDGGFARGLASLERAVDAALRRVDARVMLLLRSPAAPPPPADAASAAACAAAAQAAGAAGPLAGFDLPRHLAAARRYLLLGQGDFAAALLDAAAPELRKPCAQVSDVALEHALRAAVQASAARDDDPDTLDRLRARRARGGAGASGGGQTGWDVFALQYEVGGGVGGRAASSASASSLACGGAGGGGGRGRAPLASPLAAVFTSEAMASYRRVGRLMWRLRRAERALADVWRALKTEVERGARRLRPGSAARRGVEALLREALGARNEAAALVARVQHYVAFEVVEGAWGRFSAAAGAARDLDALVAAHSAYLADVERGALLQQQQPQGQEQEQQGRTGSGGGGLDGDGGGTAATPLAALDALLDDALALHPAVARLADGVARAVAWLDDRSQRAAAATAAGGWGATAETEGVEDGGGALGPAELGAVAAELAALRKGREARRGLFARLVREANEAGGGGGGGGGGGLCEVVFFGREAA